MHNTQVSVLACDLANPLEVTNLIRSISAEGPLDAVFHVAATTGRASATQDHPSRDYHASSADPQAVMLNLHEATANLPLSAFAIFSLIDQSQAGTTEAIASAAHSFAEAVVNRRRALGLPATSMIVGPWAEEAGQGEMQPDEQRGPDASQLRPVLPCLVLARAADLLRSDLSGFAVTDVRESLKLGAQAPELTEIFRERLRGLPPSHQRSLILTLIQSTTGLALGQTTAEAISPDVDFLEIGLTSLGAIELRNQLMKATALSLPASIVYDIPTPAALAEYIHSELIEAENQLDAEKNGVSHDSAADSNPISPVH
jgi:acyl carrier protein